MCRGLLLPQQAVAQGIGGSLGAIGRAGFGKDVTDVCSDRIEADAQDISNLSVALPHSQETQHLDLALAEVVEGGKYGGYRGCPLLALASQTRFERTHAQRTRCGQGLVE